MSTKNELVQKVAYLQTEIERLKAWQNKIRQSCVQAQNIGFCEIKNGRRFNCSLDKICEQAKGE